MVDFPASTCPHTTSDSHQIKGNNLPLAYPRVEGQRNLAKINGDIVISNSSRHILLIEIGVDCLPLEPRVIIECNEVEIIASYSMTNSTMVVVSGSLVRPQYAAVTMVRTMVYAGATITIAKTAVSKAAETIQVQFINTSGEDPEVEEAQLRR